MAPIYLNLVTVADDAQLVLMHCFIQGNMDDSIDAGNKCSGACSRAGERGSVVDASVCAKNRTR